MTGATIAKRFPIGRIVWVRLLGQWTRGSLVRLTAGPTVEVLTEAGLEVYVHASCASHLRVSEPYVWSR